MKWELNRRAHPHTHIYIHTGTDTVEPLIKADVEIKIKNKYLKLIISVSRHTEITARQSSAVVSLLTDNVFPDSGAV